MLHHWKAQEQAQEAPLHGPKKINRLVSLAKTIIHMLSFYNQ